jgi:hypothetical protein
MSVGAPARRTPFEWGRLLAVRVDDTTVSVYRRIAAVGPVATGQLAHELNPSERCMKNRGPLVAEQFLQLAPP